jgi:hypothetical protein
VGENGKPKLLEAIDTIAAVEGVRAVVVSTAAFETLTDELLSKAPSSPYELLYTTPSKQQIYIRRGSM